MVWWAYSSCTSLTAPRVEGSNPIFPFSFISRKKNHKSTKGSRQEEIEKRAGTVPQEWREEEEEPAGVSGTKQNTTKEDGLDEAIQSD